MCTHYISIHALRVEGDTGSSAGNILSAYFYPRPPCGGRPMAGPYDSLLTYFYPRPPCGGRRRPACRPESAFYFYPRPPCGGRRQVCYRLAVTVEFLSTPSVWRATGLLVPADGIEPISIHALRVEGDDGGLLQNIKLHNFYPRPPCGGRRLPAREKRRK